MEHEVCEENTGKKTSLHSWNKEVIAALDKLKSEKKTCYFMF